MAGIPVLMYHAIEDATHPSAYTEPGDRVYALHTDVFREQVAYLRDNNFNVVTLQDLTTQSTLPEHSVLLTFDDGHASDCTLALPILQDAGFRADFFITTGLTGKPHYLSPTQLKMLADAEMGIGSHSVSHRYMDDLTPDEVTAELRDSRDTLQDITGKSVTTFSAPGGRLHEQLPALAKALGYEVLCNSKFGLYQAGTPVFDVPRIALKNTMTMDIFRKIVHCDTRFMLKKQFAAGVLKTAKTVLGNRGYETVRARLLRQ